MGFYLHGNMLFNFNSKHYFIPSVKQEAFSILLKTCYFKKFSNIVSDICDQINLQQKLFWKWQLGDCAPFWLNFLEVKK